MSPVLLSAVLFVAGAVGAIMGGWSGAALARRIDPARVRTGVLVFAWALTVWFFVRAFAG